MACIVEKQPVRFIPSVFMEEAPKGPSEGVSRQICFEYDLEPVFFQRPGYVFDIPYCTRQRVPTFGVIAVTDYQGI